MVVEKSQWNPFIASSKEISYLDKQPSLTSILLLSMPRLLYHQSKGVCCLPQILSLKLLPMLQRCV